MGSWFQMFFVSFFTATTNPAAAGQCSQGLRVETFCGQICSALHYLLWDPDSVLPSISLWKAAFRIASGQDDNSHVTTFQPMQLSFLVLLQFRWCSWHILRPGCRPAAGWSDFVPLWSSWFDPKDITEGPKHTAFGGCNCRIHLSALSWPCIWDALETLFASEWWTSDTLPIHFLILSDVAISTSQVQVRVAGGTVFVKRLGECRDSELNLEAELLSFIHGDDVKLRERQLNLVRIRELW